MNKKVTTTVADILVLFLFLLFAHKQFEGYSKRGIINTNFSPHDFFLENIRKKQNIWLPLMLNDEYLRYNYQKVS